MLNSDRRLCERDEPLWNPLLDDIPDRVSLYGICVRWICACRTGATGFALRSFTVDCSGSVLSLYWISQTRLYEK